MLKQITMTNSGYFPMQTTSSTMIQRSLALLVLMFISLISLATIPEIKPGTPFQTLKPESSHTITTQQIMANLLRGHYESQPLNDQLSSKVLDIALDDLDSTRSYFLKSDVQEFEQFRTTLDNSLSRGDMKPAFFMYNRFQQRVSERLSFLINELENNAGQYTLDDKETLDLEREKAPWVNTLADMNVLWQKRLKNAIINLKLAGKKHDESLALLKKRYQNQLNRVHLSKPEDAYQAFMNSVTRAFDPHTQYFSPRNTENFNINMSLSLQGIGAVLQTEDEHTKVVRLVPAGPADKAGNLQPADKIIGVGQDKKGEIIDVIGWRLDEVVEMIRGPKGSIVRLEVMPSDKGGQSKVISIVRDEVKLEEQSAQKEIIELKDGDKTHKIGVIDIPTFYIDFQGRMEHRPDYRSTTRDVSRLIAELEKEEVEGLIIDLRNNGGGSLEEAISLTGLFIPSGPVVQVRSVNGRVEVLRDKDPTVLYDGPVTVLVNRLSASASEIFAGAIQDYGRGLIVGGQTFGKGTVQSLRRLNRGQLKITQAKFYRVSGDSTQHQGVIPDILFPSLFDKEKIGESALDEALPWDTIRPARRSDNTALRQSITTLRDQHQQRIAKNPDFLFIRGQKTLIEELREQTQVSLNEKIRREQREKNDSRRLAMENTRRQSKGLPLLDSLDELEDDDDKTSADSDKKSSKKSARNNVKEKEIASKKADKKTDKKEDREEDAVLAETGHILLDYIQLSGKPAKTPIAQHH